MSLTPSDSGSHYRRIALATCGVAAAAASALAAAKTWRRLRELLKRRELDLNGDSPGDVHPDSFSWAEIARHQKLDSIWIVLHDRVYDITPFLDEHPGGRALLLAYAGHDATDMFDTIGHSPIASRHLKEMRIGSLVLGARPSAATPSQALGFSKVTDNEGKQHAVGLLPRMASSMQMMSEAEPTPLWEVSEYGFLPSRDPVGLNALFGTPFEEFARLAEMMPTLAVTGSFRRHLLASPKLTDSFMLCDRQAVDDLDEDQLERAFSVVGFCIIVYWRGANHRYGNGISAELVTPPGSTAVTNDIVIPEFLSAPMQAICARLGRPPMIDYAATVLYNWERIDASKPISIENLRVQLRLTGLSDEEWFFKTHVVIEAEAAPAVAALAAMMDAKDDRELLRHLLAAQESLWRVVRMCMPLMYDRGDDGVARCNEHIFYQILRPLITTGPVKFHGDTEPRLLHGPSGAMSSLMPAVDAALGIQISSQKLKDALDLFGGSMPQSHQDFLAKMRTKTSVRTRIQLSRPVGGASDADAEHYSALVRAYNRCISRVLDFRWQHWQYVKNFIMKPGNLGYAMGTGGTSFDYLQQHIADTEQARIGNVLGGAQTGVATPYEHEAIHLPSIVAHRQTTAQHALGLWSVDGACGLLFAEPMPGLEEWDLWQASMPAMLHVAVKALLDLCLRLPVLCLTDNLLYTRCEDFKEDLVALRQESVIIGLSEVNRERLLTLLCHIASCCSATSRDKKAPKCIDRPLQVFSRVAGRSPSLDTVALVLANWSEEGLPPAEGSEGGEITLRNVVGFLGSPDEEWYRSLHIILHHHAKDVVSIIRAGQAADIINDDHAVIRTMDRLSAWMIRFCDYFDAHYEQKDSRTEPVMMARFNRVFRHKADSDEQACWVYCCGSSVLLPMLHAFLGVPMGKILDTIDCTDAARLGKRMQQWVEEMPHYMPMPHKAFLDELQRSGNLRQYCIKRFGQKGMTLELLHDFEVAYNEALNALIRFLARRMHLVHRFQPHLSSNFSTMHSHIEAGVRKKRLTLLKMRQRVDACLEK